MPFPFPNQNCSCRQVCQPKGHAGPGRCALHMRLKHCRLIIFRHEVKHGAKVNHVCRVCQRCECHDCTSPRMRKTSFRASSFVGCRPSFAASLFQTVFGLPFVKVIEVLIMLAPHKPELRKDCLALIVTLRLNRRSNLTWCLFRFVSMSYPLRID